MAIDGTPNAARALEHARGLASALNARLTIVTSGTRSRGRLASTLLGSVAGGVHFHVHAPLLVVHPDEEDED